MLDDLLAYSSSHFSGARVNKYGDKGQLWRRKSSDRALYEAVCS